MESFSINRSSTKVFELIVTNLMSEKSLTFPCSIHCVNKIAFAVMYYVRMRMRQFSYQENENKNRKTGTKRKLQSFTKLNF